MAFAYEYMLPGAGWLWLGLVAGQTKQEQECNLVGTRAQMSKESLAGFISEAGVNGRMGGCLFLKNTRCAGRERCGLFCFTRCHPLFRPIAPPSSPAACVHPGIHHFPISQQ